MLVKIADHDDRVEWFRNCANQAISYPCMCDDLIILAAVRLRDGGDAAMTFPLFLAA